MKLTGFPCCDKYSLNFGVVHLGADLFKKWPIRRRRLTPTIHEEKLDPIDIISLEYIYRVCRESSSMAEAGRKIFAVSREKRKTQNDSDRVKQLLMKYALTWEMLKE